MAGGSRAGRALQVAAALLLAELPAALRLRQRAANQSAPQPPAELRAVLPMVTFGAQAHWCNSPYSSVGVVAKPAAEFDAYWRLMVPSILHALGRRSVLTGDYYQFGVAQGWSMSLLRDHFPGRKMWGFDSFRGLPGDQGAKNHPAWHRGAYSSGGVPPTLVAQLGGPDYAEMIPGFYNVSLTPTLAVERGMRTAQYVDVDVDLYVSAHQALDWLFAQKLVTPGTLIGYDDWWPISCMDLRGDPLRSGEGLAHAQVARKYAVEFACVGGPCAMPANLTQCSIFGNYAPIFLVVSVGERADTGFRMTAAQRLAWMQGSQFCQQQHAQFGKYASPGA